MFSPKMFQTIEKDEFHQGMHLQERLQLALRALHHLYLTARHRLQWKLKDAFEGTGQAASAEASSSSDEDDEDKDDDDDDDDDDAEESPLEPAEENGVYRVGCFQVAQWSNSSKNVNQMLHSKEKRVPLDHYFLDGNTGEAQFRMVFSGSDE